MANYSSLFTMGLSMTSEHGSPPSSPKSHLFHMFRKSSLPTKALSRPSESLSLSKPAEDLRASVEFSNPFGESPKAANELRSFLSLDLASEKSLRLHRSNRSRLSPLDTNVPPHSSSPTSASRTPRPHQHTPSSTRHLPVPPSPLSAPFARRPSRDSLRNLPSPRPAPSSALPQIPSSSKEAPVLPPLELPEPALFSSSSPSPSPKPTLRIPPVHHAPSRSAPPTISIPSTSSLSPITSDSPVSPRASWQARPVSFVSFSSTSTSIRTTRKRNVERSNALACLEGRSPAPGRIPRSTRQRNFMSMSDDEDDEPDADAEDDGPAARSAPTPSFVLATPPPSRRTTATVRSPVDEEEDRVLPVNAAAAVRPKMRPRRSTLESWFPLANFIDLKDDELSGWRGVVEIVSGL
ncbi:hypothetical protein BC834DRAFT_634587 [Gloeopeniophorella convolvens]|nr:hypothetical protein BC834DRAFT_634587 [Gloeopeniophorella convolvens]